MAYCIKNLDKTISAYSESIDGILSLGFEQSQIIETNLECVYYGGKIYLEGEQPSPTDEQGYYAEREAVRRKYEAPNDGAKEGILYSYNTMYTSAMMAGKTQGELDAIAQEKIAAQAAMKAEYDAIDVKYGVTDGN